MFGTSVFCVFVTNVLCLSSLFYAWGNCFVCCVCVSPPKCNIRLSCLVEVRVCDVPPLMLFTSTRSEIFGSARRHRPYMAAVRRPGDDSPGRSEVTSPPHRPSNPVASGANRPTPTSVSWSPRHHITKEPCIPDPATGQGGKILKKTQLKTYREKSRKKTSSRTHKK